MSERSPLCVGCRMEGGEVFDQITDRGSFTESEARRVIEQVAEGVRFLHDQGIVHRDLKVPSSSIPRLFASF